ncbi:hypothetical protein ADJ70_05590 [Olsenella sp. oral taxon 807]|nr:hypothetical protein ADJ70_05590 [Olsenella sp. oral taxon 807]
MGRQIRGNYQNNHDMNLGRMECRSTQRDQQTGEWRDRANWVDVVVFGSRADAIAPRLAKGSKVAVSGRLRWSQWQDKQTGTNRSKLEVIADEVVFLTPQQQPTNQAQQQAPQGRAYAPQATQAAPRPQAAPAYAPPAQGVYDESIPF